MSRCGCTSVFLLPYSQADADSAFATIARQLRFFQVKKAADKLEADKATKAASAAAAKAAATTALEANAQGDKAREVSIVAFVVTTAAISLEDTNFVDKVLNYVAWERI